MMPSCGAPSSSRTHTHTHPLYSLIVNDTCVVLTPPSLATGLYVDPKGARGALKKYAGLDPASLSKDKSLFKALGQAGGFAKYLHLVFARSVGAQKVVDALTSVKGVSKDVLDRCVGRGEGRVGGGAVGGEGSMAFSGSTGTFLLGLFQSRKQTDICSFRGSFQ